MNIEVAHRLNGIGEYYFSKKLKEIQELNASGKNVINLGIGSPDLPPHPEVIRTLQEESAKPNAHAYQGYRGVDALRVACKQWYSTWYGVELDAASEILPLIGSKEGIVHICMTYLDEGDEVLVPNPGYPAYKSAVQLAGGVVKEYLLDEKGGIDFNALERTDLSAVKLMWVNYPHMPTGQLPSHDLFKNIVAFARRNNILICHDNPYSFILNDHPMSMLATDGAKDVVIELNSLSKSQNMAGWRVGMLCGAPERINEILRFKSNMDSGMFLPLQLAAAKALQLGAEWYAGVNKVYRERRKKMYELLKLLNCTYDQEQAGMFLWAAAPPAYGDGYAMSDAVLHKAGVFITPGGIFGSAGEKYIRASLCSPEEKLDEAIERITTKFVS